MCTGPCRVTMLLTLCLDSRGMEGEVPMAQRISVDEAEGVTLGDDNESARATSDYSGLSAGR